jgi:hypothetical protein
LTAKRTRSTGWFTAELLLSLATGPLLVGLVGQKILNEAMQELGAFSEEIFRGDRLPILNVPPASPELDDTMSDQP